MTTEEQDERRKAAVQAFEQREAEAARAKADLSLIMCGTRRVGSRPVTWALVVRWNPAGRDICAPALYLLYGLPSSSLASTQWINSPARDRGMQVSTFATGFPQRQTCGDCTGMSVLC